MRFSGRVEGFGFRSMVSLEGWWQAKEGQEEGRTRAQKSQFESLASTEEEAPTHVDISEDFLGEDGHLESAGEKVGEGKGGRAGWLFEEGRRKSTGSVSQASREHPTTAARR